VNANNLSFAGNTSGESGGAVAANGRVFLDFKANDNMNFTENVAVSSGGAVFSRNGKVFLNSSNILFDNNISSSVGGAVAAYNSFFDFTADSMTFTGNRAITGGAVYLKNSTATFTGNVLFDSNTASGASGGAVDVDGSNIAFNGNNISFKNNTAFSGNGGAINVYQSTITINSLNEINFSGNKAENDLGGAIYAEDSRMSFAAKTITFDNNTAYEGAVFSLRNAAVDFTADTINFTDNSSLINSNEIIGSAVAFSGKTMNFTGNTGFGGAFLVEHSTVNFNADSAGTAIKFEDNANYAGGDKSDLYLGSDSIVNFNAVNGAITLTNGIRTIGSAGEGTINKTGAQALYFGGDSEVQSSFNVTGGDIVFLDNATFKGKNMLLSAGSGLDMQNTTVNTIEVGDFASLTNTKMDIFANGTNDKVTAGSASIGGNLDIKARVGTYTNKEYQIIVTTATQITTVFAGASGTAPLSYTLNYTDDQNIVKLIVNGVYASTFTQLGGLSFNQKQVAKTFDKLSESGSLSVLMADTITDLMGESDEAQRDTLAQASGYFLSNIIRNFAADSPNNEIYDRIKNHCIEGKKPNSGIWAQAKGGQEIFKENGNSIGDYTDNSWGIMAGYDRYTESDIMLGIYGRFNSDDIEQGKNRAEGQKNGLGVYGGYIKEAFEFKAMLMGSYDMFKSERKVMGSTAKADINAVTVNADLEGALKVGLTESMSLRPYMGIEAENTMYDGFTEKGAGAFNLEVEGDSYLRSAARAGVGVQYGKGRLGWYVNAEGKYLISGYEPEIDAVFDGTDVSFKSRGAKEGLVAFGAGLGADFRIYKGLKFFVNGNYYTADNYQNIYGNAGVRYSFCGVNGKKDGQEKAVKTVKKEGDSKSAAQQKQKEEADRQAAEEAAKKQAADEQARLEAEQKAAADEAAKKQAAIDSDNEAAMVQAREEAKKRREKPVLKSFSMDMASFATGSAKLTDKSKENIALQASEVKQFEYNHITIEGHTDSTGSVATNKKLSTQRAKAVFDEFAANGIPAEKMSYIGFGSSMPKAGNKTAEGRAQNRRVEIFVE
jgi:predicted outer membrane repeat protein